MPFSTSDHVTGVAIGKPSRARGNWLSNRVFASYTDRRPLLQDLEEAHRAALDYHLASPTGQMGSDQREPVLALEKYIEPLV